MQLSSMFGTLFGYHKAVQDVCKDYGSATWPLGMFPEDYDNYISMQRFDGTEWVTESASWKESTAIMVLDSLKTSPVVPRRVVLLAEPLPHIEVLPHDTQRFAYRS